MADPFSIKFDFSAIDRGLDEIVAAANAQVRPAAQAGAQVLYDEVLIRVPVNAKVVTKKGGRQILPGALKGSIYQVFSEDNSGEGRATYHVSWNYRKAPHGHLVEFGTSRAPAHPFLRPSFDARHNDALQASKLRMLQGMQATVASLK